MGYIEQTEQWTEHQDNFNKLLENLNGSSDSNDADHKKVSLEEKSSKSRARVHYQKFTRGKDLSRYSEKDLANILGKKSFQDPIKPEPLEEQVTDSKSNSHGVQTINSGSMADYFKRKLPNFTMNNGYSIGTNGVLKAAEIDSESELERPSFGFGFSTNNVIGVNSFNEADMDNNEVSDVHNKKNKKSKSKKDTFVCYIPETNEINATGTVNSADEASESVKKKKKKKKPKENHEVKSSFVSYLSEGSNPFNSSDESAKKRKHFPEGSIDSPAKPKKRKLEAQNNEPLKNEPNLGISNPAFDPMSRSVTVEKHILRSINEIETDEESNNQDVTNKSATNKENKPNSQFDYIEESESSTLNNSISTENPYEVKVKKSKKSKNPKNSYAVDNLNYNEESEVSTLNQSNNIENPYEVKVKKKSKKSKKCKDNYAIDNPNFNLHDSLQSIESNEETNEKKKRKSNEALTEEIDCDIMLNVSAAPISTTSTDISPRNELIHSNKTKKRRKSVRFSNVNEERIIPNNDDLKEMANDQNKMDLFDINTKIIENSLEEQAKKDGKNGIVNSGFDMRSIDKISFYASKGVENAAFNENAIAIEESMMGIRKKLDNCQAEIENDINEAKDTKSNEEVEEQMYLGDIGSNKQDHEKTKNGVLLAFKRAKFGKDPKYAGKHSGAKKSYKHLIKGDLHLNFKNTNLHKIDGYGNFKKE